MKKFFSSQGYELEHKIGQGGFGSVYQAVHKKTEQCVAIKCINLDAQSNENHKQQIERFERECSFVAKLNHPNIVRLLDKGKISQTNVYSVFEYVDGTNLSDYLKAHGALSIEEAYPIMLQILDALVHAHQQGIIHRDIKPSNIMLSQTGAKKNAKLLDFGISTLTINQRSEDFKAITITQESVGTPSYCSPEQLRGEPDTFKSDLYMWGLVFIESLTGSPAVSGTSIADLYHQHLSDTPVAIPGSLLSHPLGHILQRTLRKNVSERIESAQTLFEELEKIVISNLVGQFRAVKPAQQEDLATLILRKDDPNHILNHYTPATERKQITTLALQISVKSFHQTPNNSILESLYHATRRQCIDIAQRYGGFHVGNLGDLSVFYFGYPVASDHDARLAARTALELISLINKQQGFMLEHHQCQYSANIGLHTGIIVKHGNQVPDGFASHQACSLSRQARDNSILCSMDTMAILDAYYLFKEMTLTSGRFAELTGERNIEAFGFIRGTRNNYPLVGRSHELATLKYALSPQSQNNSSTAIHLHGDAGIGKSRLIHEFRRFESARSQQIFQCLPEHQNNALYPILTFTKHVLDYLFDDISNKGKQLNKLLSTATFQEPKDEVITLLAAWLGIDDLEKQYLSTTDPIIQKKRLFEGLSFILSIYERHRLINTDSKTPLCIFEDIHWADTTTLEFIAFLTQQHWQGNRLIITTSRLNMPALFDNNVFKCIHLEPLKPTDTRAFITSLFDGTTVSDQVMTLLESRTDGVPLFIEELVSMLKRQRLVHMYQGAIEFVAPEHTHDIPTTLRESIQDKIDSLIYAKDTLQLASAIGREFSYNLLVASSDFSELQVQNDLSELIENQLIIQLRQVNGDRYLFKHALVRDTAYDSIDKQTLPDIHGLIALSISKSTVNFDRFTMAELAGHYEKSNQFDKASKYYYQAANEADKNYAINDAIHLYQRALETCYASHDFPKEEKETYLIKILEGLSEVLNRNGQHEASRNNLEKLIFLLEIKKWYKQLATAQVNLGKTYKIFHQHDQALYHYDLANQTLDKAPHSKTPDSSEWWKIWLEVKRAVLYVHYWLGNSKHMEPILKSIEPVVQAINDPKEISKYYHDYFQFQLRKKSYLITLEDLAIQYKALKYVKKCNDAALLAYIRLALGLGLILCKNFKEAIVQLEQANKSAKELNEKVILARCCTYLTVSYRLLKDINNTRKYAERSLLISRELKMNEYTAVALGNLSWSYFSEKNYKQSNHYIKQCLSQWNQITKRFEYPLLWLSHLHAIALYDKITRLTKSQEKEVIELATALLGPHQMPLPNTIMTVLYDISTKVDSSQYPILIRKLSKAAVKENFI